MTTESATATSYDEVLYPSDPLPQSHPDRLATVARLFGGTPAPIERCRVLELGCGTGGNLVPMAERHRESTFLGVDFSRRQIELGRQAIAALSLANVQLVHGSIMDLGEELGTFDYIICHGVFAWVTRELQEKILSLCKACLAPQGVAYISYNVYPAWHLRSVIREVGRHAGPRDQPLSARLTTMRSTLEVVAKALVEEGTSYGKFLGDDMEFVLTQPDNYLIHEYLEDESRPSYFHEFARRIGLHGLQYLGDSTLWIMFPTNLGATAERNLSALARDLISAEQYMDVLWNRSFRNTLVCHDSVRLQRQLTSASLSGLYFVGQLQPQSPAPDLSSASVERFATPAGISIGATLPAAKAALFHLATRWPRAVSFEELLAVAPATASPQGREQVVGDALIQCLAVGIVEARFAPDSFVATVGAQPRASALARAQAVSSPRVTNLRHEVVVLDEVAQNTLIHLDGSNDRAALMQVLREAMRRGRLSIYRNGVPLGVDEGTDAILASALAGALTTLAENALLVG